MLVHIIFQPSFNALIVLMGSTVWHVDIDAQCGWDLGTEEHSVCFRSFSTPPISLCALHKLWKCFFFSFFPCNLSPVCRTVYQTTSGLHPGMRHLKWQVFWRQHSLGHQGEGFSAHCRTWHQLDHHVFAGGLKMHPRHLLQHRRQGGHIASLCARVPACSVQDVPPVHHQQQHMRLTFTLQTG